MAGISPNSIELRVQGMELQAMRVCELRRRLRSGTSRADGKAGRHDIEDDAHVWRGDCADVHAAYRGE